MKYQELYDWTIENGGFTVRIADNVIPTKGFAVGSAVGQDIVIESSDTEGFDQSIKRMLVYAARYDVPVEYLGAWLHEGNIYIDAVNVFADKSFALGVAWERREKAIYDLSKGRDIPMRYNK